MRCSRSSFVVRCVSATLCVFASIATASETSMQKETVERRSPVTKIDEQGFVSIGGIDSGSLLAEQALTTR